MATTKLTEKQLLNAPPGDYWDSLAPGLFLRVGARTKVWRVAYDLAGRRAYLKLGRYPVVSLADARKAARAAHGKVEQREDPKRHVEVIPDGGRESLADIIDDYTRLHVDVKLKTKTASDYKSRLKRIKAALGHKPVTLLTRRDVLDVTEGYAAAGKSAEAAATHRLFHALLNWTVARGVLPMSPIHGLKPPSRVKDRDHTLPDGELLTVWIAAKRLPYPWGPFVRVLILCGQRVSEVARMRWDDLDGNRWTLPDTKRGTPHLVELPPQAMAILEADDFPRFEGYVFSTDGGVTPMSPGSNLKAEPDPQRTRAKTAEKKRGHRPGKLDAAVAELLQEDDSHAVPAPWRLHDLRRTAASVLGRLGVQPHVIEATLNHKSGQIRGVARVYQRYGYAAEIGHALRRWGDHVESLGTPRPDNVVKLAG